MRSKYNGVISSNFDSQLYTDIFISYENKFEAIQRSITFENIEYNGFLFYKKATKYNKKGDLNKVNIKKTKTKLSITLTYLARYGNTNIVNYINNQLETETNIDKINFYQSILYYINKFGLDRLLKLAIERRERVLKHYSEPINFKSLTFCGRSRKVGNIISYNENYNSVISSFINLSWLTRGSTLSIPVKYSKNYHGNMKDYVKKTNDIEYGISFTDDNRVKINICKDGDRFIPDGKENYVGIDVNIKHNMFKLSDGASFDYNRQMIDILSKELLKIDKLKKDKDYVVGKRKEKKVNCLCNKLIKDIEFKCSELCKYLILHGLDHIIMEDLQKTFGKNYSKTENDLNYNRIMSILNMSSIKDVVEHIARKYDICVSTIHACYTSKMCPICGCIDDCNRLNQETFECVECGHKDNADLNAAINIKNRVALTVLRSNLLKQTKLNNGTYEPKILERYKVKDVLLSAPLMTC
jgi:putative transposase